MGWFDNEEEAGTPTAAAAQSPAHRPATKTSEPTPKAESGSTLGRGIHVEGAIVCHENLMIQGQVDGTIRVGETLVIAKEADVRAKIDGRRVMVHGKLAGNVNGVERVVLGQTARLTGNIKTPILEIIEGARFNGNAEMPASQPAKRKPEKKTAVAPVVMPDADPRSDAKAATTTRPAGGSGKPVTV